MMKGYAFCPNCFQTGTYNGYICKACGYIQEQKDKYVYLLNYPYQEGVLRLKD